MQPKSEELKFVTKNDGYVHIHPSSVNYQVGMAGILTLHGAGLGGAHSASSQQTSWGRLDKHEHTGNWTVFGKTVSISQKF